MALKECHHQSFTILLILSIGTLFGEQFGGITYEISEGEIVITGFTEDSTSVDVEIPNEIEGQPVKAIGEKAFLGFHSVNSITIPANVTSIGDQAFAECNNLEKVRFLGNAPSTGTNVFGNSHGRLRIYFLADRTGFTSPKWEEHLTIMIEGEDFSAWPWEATGALAGERYGHSATLLHSGKVLVAGGAIPVQEDDGLPVSTAELYDPASGRWTATESLTYARSHHSATLLRNGNVIVVGGEGGAAGAELYDPNTGEWSVTKPINSYESVHTSTRLPSGKVFVIGTNGGEFYDPINNEWTLANRPRVREVFASVLLHDGKVFLIGDASSRTSVNLYDPETGIWFVSGAPTFRYSRHTASATLLHNGKVLLTGGVAEGCCETTVAEVYDPIGNGGLGSLAKTEPYAQEWSPRGHTATLLPNGKVLFAGNSFEDDGASDHVALYDPVENAWTAAAHLNFKRGNHSATLLPNGQVLVVGGLISIRLGTGTASAELYNLWHGKRPESAPLTLTRILSSYSEGIKLEMTGTSGALFRVYSSSDLSAPLSEWTALGYPAETTIGQYQFIESQVWGQSQRFYRVTGP